MTQREAHLKEIHDIETLYKNVEHDLEIELTDREKVIISLLAMDYRGVQITNYNKKVSQTMYAILRFGKWCEKDGKKAVYEHFIESINKFAKDKGIEVYVSRSNRHVDYTDAPIYSVHMHGHAEDVADMVAFFDLKASHYFYDREIDHNYK